MVRIENATEYPYHYYWDKVEHTYYRHSKNQFQGIILEKFLFFIVSQFYYSKRFILRSRPTQFNSIFGLEIEQNIGVIGENEE